MQKFHPGRKPSEKEQLFLDSGHVWEEDYKGYIDIFAGADYGIHNSPKCINCGYDKCWHCHPIPPKECK